MVESNLETKLTRNQKIRAGVETVICLGAAAYGAHLANYSLHSESPIRVLPLMITALGTVFSIKLAYEIGRYAFTGKYGNSMKEIEYPW